MSSGSRIATAESESWSVAYLGLGTNIGDRATNLRRALAELGRLTHIEAVSSIYESAPVGFTEQPRFWNMVVRVRTALPPRLLLDGLLAIEQLMGRTRSFPNAPRTIDVDILIYDDVVMDIAGLTLPHPRMNERSFVLKPMVELAPDLRHPASGELIADILQRGRFGDAEIVTAE